MSRLERLRHGRPAEDPDHATGSGSYTPGAGFSLNNQMAVSLNFLVFETQPHGVAVWIIMSFVIGALFGLLIALMATFRTSVSRRHLKKKLERTEQALEKSKVQNDRAL